jgi:hypothetical protein
MSFSVYSPTSFSSAAGPSSALVVSETRICPPFAAAPIRAARTVEPEVALVADRGLARMQPHPHLEFDAVGPVVRRERALRGDGRRDGVAGTREREEEGVTLAVDLMPTGSRTAVAHDPAVLGFDGCIVVDQLLEQPR